MTFVLFPFIAVFGMLWYTVKFLVWVGKVLRRAAHRRAVSRKASRQRRFDAVMAPLVREYRR